MQQLDGQAKQAIGQLQQELQNIKASKDNEQRKLLIDSFRAETERMKVIGEQQMQALQTAQIAQADLMAQQAPQVAPAQPQMPPQQMQPQMAQPMQPMQG
jgi:hypothetical protein